MYVLFAFRIPKQIHVSLHSYIFFHSILFIFSVYHVTIQIVCVCCACCLFIVLNENGIMCLCALRLAYSQIYLYTTKYTIYQM